MLVAHFCSLVYYATNLRKRIYWKFSQKCDTSECPEASIFISFQFSFFFSTTNVVYFYCWANFISEQNTICGAGGGCSVSESELYIGGSESGDDILDPENECGYVCLNSYDCAGFVYFSSAKRCFYKRSVTCHSATNAFATCYKRISNLFLNARSRIVVLLLGVICTFLFIRKRACFSDFSR